VSETTARDRALDQAFPASSGRVLVIDSRAPTQDSELENLLAQRGIAGLRAGSTEDAIALARRDGADIIIIVNDSKRAKGEIERMARRLKTIPAIAPIPIIVIGGAASAADSILPRRFQSTDLFARLDVYMRLNTMREELARRFATARKFGVDGLAPPLASEPLTDARILVVGAPEAAEIGAVLGAGIDIVGARSRADALARLQSENLDAVVLVGSGDNAATRDLCRGLRTDTRHYSLPLMVITDPKRSPAVAAANPDDVVERGDSPDEVRHRLLALVRQHRQRQAMRQLYLRSRHPKVTDPRTQLYSRDYLLAHLGSQLDHAKRFGRSLTVAVIEAATAGGRAGDPKLWQPLADLVIGAVRVEDLVARHSARTIAVVLPDTAPELAVFALHRVATLVEGAGLGADLRLKIGATGALPGDTAESALDRAAAEMI
jgi:PleD family two-component response regulator